MNKKYILSKNKNSKKHAVFRASCVCSRKEMEKTNEFCKSNIKSYISTTICFLYMHKHIFVVFFIGMLPIEWVHIWIIIKWYKWLLLCPLNQSSSFRRNWVKTQLITQLIGKLFQLSSKNKICVVLPLSL